MIIQVSSHRRSGTHALIDLIRTRFRVHGDFFHLEDILDWPLEDLRSRAVIVKTHEPKPRQKLNLFVEQNRISDKRAEVLAEITVNIHAYRHPKEVLRSLYYFNLKGHEPIYRIPGETTFSDFLKQKGVQDAAAEDNRVQFWQRTVRNWVYSDGVLVCDYRTIVTNPASMLDELAAHLGLPITEGASDEVPSTAIGRGTTQQMADGNLWTTDANIFYESQVDRTLLSELGLEGN